MKSACSYICSFKQRHRETQSTINLCPCPNLRSSTSFLSKKTAEQDASKLALEVCSPVSAVSMELVARNDLHCVFKRKCRIAERVAIFLRSQGLGFVNLSKIVERRVLKAKRLLGTGFNWREVLMKFYEAKGRKLPEIVVEQVTRQAVFSAKNDFLMYLNQRHKAEYERALGSIGFSEDDISWVISFISLQKNSMYFAQIIIDEKTKFSSDPFGFQEEETAIQTAAKTACVAQKIPLHIMPPGGFWKSEDLYSQASFQVESSEFSNH